MLRTEKRSWIKFWRTQGIKFKFHLRMIRLLEQKENHTQAPTNIAFHFDYCV
jgi:hypothetical protein